MELPFILNDRGYRRAIKEGWITVSPEVEDVQFQPASLDLRIREVVAVGPLFIMDPYNPVHRVDSENYPSMPYNLEFDPDSLEELVIPAFSTCQVRVDDVDFPPVSLGSIADTLIAESVANGSAALPGLNQIYRSVGQRLDTMSFASIFGKTDVVLRSSMGKLGLAISQVNKFGLAPFRLVNDDESYAGMAIYVKNYSPYSIRFKEGERIAQMFTEVQSMAVHPFNIVDHGVILEYEPVLEVHKAGLFEVKPELEVDPFGYIMFHASDKAHKMVGPENGNSTIDFSDRKTVEYDEVTIPPEGLAIKPFEYWAVQAVETVRLSNQVAIDFVSHPVTSTHAFRPGTDFFDTYNFEVCNAGWFDPGYEGVYFGHPKTMLRQHLIKPGDPIGWGRAYLFGNGVERPYGSDDLGSHYQHADDFRVE